MRSPALVPRNRYLALIDATLRHGLSNRPVSPNSAAITMDFALPAIACQLGMIRATDPLLTTVLDRVSDAQPIDAVADGAGNVRPAYRALLMHALTPFLHAHLGGAGTYAKRALAATTAFAADEQPLAASDGASVVSGLIDANTLSKMKWWVGDSADRPVRDAFARVVAAQCADGTFLARTSADQLEPAWYHELAVLHAVTIYARRTGNPPAASAVRRSARYHAEQVQPDHASSHPFGLAALLNDAEGIHLADMMLHAAGVQQPATMDATSLVLLFDALDCERRGKPA